MVLRAKSYFVVAFYFTKIRYLLFAFQHIDVKQLKHISIGLYLLVDTVIKTQISG